MDLRELASHPTSQEILKLQYDYLVLVGIERIAKYLFYIFIALGFLALNQSSNIRVKGVVKTKKASLGGL